VGGQVAEHAAGQPGRIVGLDDRVVDPGGRTAGGDGEQARVEGDGLVQIPHMKATVGCPS
jgi:hypothetical protein